MRRTLAVVIATAVPATAQAATSVIQGTTTVTSGTAVETEATLSGAMAVKRLLSDGYEVKTGFSDNNGGAYMVLQKATSAYMCHSNPTQTCEKLN